MIPVFSANQTKQISRMSKNTILLWCTVIVCAILCNPYTANSQGKNIPDANIVGHVISKSGKIHLPYITIGIEGTNIATMTDATGHYLLKNLPEGELSIVAACLGYKTISRKVIISKAEIIEINFEMEEDALNLDGMSRPQKTKQTRRHHQP